MDYQVTSESYSAQIRELLSQHHYTKTCPATAKYCFVLRKPGDDTIRGLLVVSPFSRNQSQKLYVNYLELSRLWVKEDEPKNTESFFIGKALKYLQKYTELDGLISYADQTMGHSGVVYRATNFKLIGETKRSYHYEKDGQPIHKKRIWAEAKKLGITEKVHARRLGLKRIPEKEKLIFEFLFRRKRGNGIIYCVRLPSNKVYIGQTVNSLDFRLRGHLNDARKGSKLRFHNALRKYEYVYEATILETAPYLKLSERENYWIDYFQAAKPDKGYNDPKAPGYAILRAPEHLLMKAFELRTQGYSYKEISQQIGLSPGVINAVIWGRIRPEIRHTWLEKNPDLEKQKTLTDKQVLEIFKLYDKGLSCTKIAQKLEVTKTYVSYVLTGKMRPDVKSRYEKSTGKPFIYENDSKVDLALASKVLQERYENRKTNVEISKELGLSPTQVSMIVQGRTAKEVSSEYIKDKKLDKNLISDDRLLQAFDLVYKDLQRQDEVAKTLDISKSLLSLVFNGRTRPEIKEKWEAVNGKAPSLKSLAQKRTMQDSSRRAKLSEQNKGKAREKPGRSRPCVCSNGIEFPTVKSAAEHYAVHANTVTWSLTHDGEPIKVKGQDLSFRYLKQEHALMPSKERAVKTSDNLEFATITEAAQHYGLDWSTVKTALERGISLQGVTFCYAFDVEG